MTVVHVVIGATILVVFTLCSVLGAWRWYRVEPSQLFWPLLRFGQGLLVLQAAIGGILLLTGHKPAGDLHFLYGLLPLVVSFAAEQLRIASAETILDARGHESASAVGELPEDQQRSVVVAILRRELGVMTISAAVVVALALRAAFASGGL